MANINDFLDEVERELGIKYDTCTEAMSIRSREAKVIDKIRKLKSVESSLFFLEMFIETWSEMTRRRKSE